MEIKLNKVAIYQGCIIHLTKYEDKYVSNTGGTTSQVINTLVFREENMAKRWIENNIQKDFSDYEIIPFVCEWKF